MIRVPLAMVQTFARVVVRVLFAPCRAHPPALVVVPGTIVLVPILVNHLPSALTLPVESPGLRHTKESKLHVARECG